MYHLLTLFLYPCVQYEPRGPGRPLYQRRISSSYPDESSPANTHNALPQQSQPCTSDTQDHPHAHIQHHQHPHAPYSYPSHDHLWPSNGGGPGPFQNIPCNGAGTLTQHRDLLGKYYCFPASRSSSLHTFFILCARFYVSVSFTPHHLWLSSHTTASKALRQAEEQAKAEATGAQQTHPHSLNSLQHQFPPLMPNNKQQQPQPPTEASQGAPNLGKQPTMSYASALRAPPKPRAVRPEQVKKNSDPLSLLQELSIGSSNGSNGYYSYFK